MTVLRFTAVTSRSGRFYGTTWRVEPLVVFASDLDWSVVTCAVMREVGGAREGTNVRCRQCRHIQWVSVELVTVYCLRCGANLPRGRCSKASADRSDGWQASLEQSGAVDGR
jgi:ribosomal protein S27E